jgi:hypothetical protein
MIVSTAQSVYFRRKSPQYALDNRLGGPQSQFGLLENRKSLAPAANLSPILNRPDHSLVDVPTGLYIKHTTNKREFRDRGLPQIFLFIKFYLDNLIKKD